MRLSFVIVTLALTLIVAAGASAQNYSATLSGLNEVPPVTGTPATGLACFTLDANKMLNYELAFSGLVGTQTGAHIHGPAPADANAGVIFGFALGSPQVGSFGPLTPAQEADLNAGLWYVNVHSTMYPGGEIRGQIQSTIVPCTTPVENRTWGGIKALYDR